MSAVNKPSPIQPATPLPSPAPNPSPTPSTSAQQIVLPEAPSTEQTLKDTGRVMHHIPSVAMRIGVPLTTSIVALDTLRGARCLSGLSLLVNTHAVFECVQTMGAEGITLDPALESVGYVGSISSDISGVMTAMPPILLHCGAVGSAHAAALAAGAASPYLLGVGTVLSLAVITSHAKGIYECKHLLKNLETTIKQATKSGQPQKSYSDTLKELFLEPKDNQQAEQARSKMIKKHFKLSSETFQTTISRITDAATGAITKSNQIQAKALSERVTETLKQRLETNIFSRYVAIIAAIANIVGMVILLACPPAGLALIFTAYGFLALCGFLSLGKIIYDRQASKHFIKDMQKNLEEAEELIANNQLLSEQKKAHVEEVETLPPSSHEHASHTKVKPEEPVLTRHTVQPLYEELARASLLA